MRGWRDIIAVSLKDIEPYGVEVLSIKEKWGRLKIIVARAKHGEDVS